jgi:hypothetical protein
MTFVGGSTVQNWGVLNKEKATSLLTYSVQQVLLYVPDTEKKKITLTLSSPLTHILAISPSFGSNKASSLKEIGALIVLQLTTYSGSYSLLDIKHSNSTRKGCRYFSLCILHLPAICLTSQINQFMCLILFHRYDKIVILKLHNWRGEQSALHTSMVQHAQVASSKIIGR